MRWIAVALVALFACQPVPREEPVATSALPSSELAPTPGTNTSPPVSGRKSYLGREIAPTMSHEGAGWLTRPEREQEEQASRMLKELGLRTGQVACDLGAGNGYHTLEMAKIVAPEGRAVAVDIQPEMLALLTERARAAKVTNVETILGDMADPKLPASSCDLVLMADVYHELDDPAGMLAKIKPALKPGGALALLEFRADDPAVPIKPEHTMSAAQMDKELTHNGFRLVRAFDGLPWQHLRFYSPR